MSGAGLSAAEVIARLALAPHPEGGWYRETWRAAAPEGARAAGTAILFLLEAHQSSHWHRVDADEIWHWHAGAPIALRVAATAEGPARTLSLGPDLATGALPQQIVPAGHWQAARPLGGWALVGCTVSPAFRFEGFELAPPGFEIPG